MVKVGDIKEVDGKTVIVTYTDGVNFAFAPYEGKAEAKEEEKPKRRARK